MIPCIPDALRRKMKSVFAGTNNSRCKITTKKSESSDQSPGNTLFDQHVPLTSGATCEMTTTDKPIFSGKRTKSAENVNELSDEGFQYPRIFAKNENRMSPATAVSNSFEPLAQMDTSNPETPNNLASLNSDNVSTVLNFKTLTLHLLIDHNQYS